MAAASIGQVHRAVLPNGRRVAVKVQRPDAPRQIEADLALLYQAARIAKERVRALDFIDARELVDEFARSIRHELDYRHGGAERADVPPPLRRPPARPHPARLLELLAPARADARDARGNAARRHRARRLHARGAATASRTLMTETWMTMIFRHGFFHGDPHPANILVIGAEQIGLVDFGQAGKLSDDDISKLTRALHRRRDRRTSTCSPSGSATSACATSARARPSSRPSCASSTTSTTARGSPRSTRCRSIREAFALIYSQNLRLPTRFVILDKAIATLGVRRHRALPGLQRLRGREAVRARPDDAPLHAAPDARAGRRKETRALAQVIRETPYQWHDVLEQARARAARGRLRAQGAGRALPTSWTSSSTGS